MVHTPISFIETLVFQEIGRMVAKAKRDGDILSASERAAKVISVYPNCGLDLSDVADKVAHPAASSGVAVEIGAPQLLAKPSAKREDAAPETTAKAKQPLNTPAPSPASASENWKGRIGTRDADQILKLGAAFLNRQLAQILAVK